MAEQNAETPVDSAPLAALKVRVRDALARTMWTRLHPRALRQFAEGLFLGEEPPPSGVWSALDALGEPSGFRRSWCAETAALVPGAANLDRRHNRQVCELLSATLHATIGRDESWLWRAYWRPAVVTVPVGIVVMLRLGAIHSMPADALGQFEWLASLVAALGLLHFLMWLILGPSFQLALLHRRTRVRAAAGLALGCLALPESAGSLARAGSDRMPAVRAAARESLKCVLPELTEEHYGRLDSDTVPNLCRALRSKDRELVLAILAGLHKIGDGRAVEAVRQLGQSTRSADMRTAAGELLPNLLERQRKELDESRLLRPSDQPDSGMLLRPAAGTDSLSADPLLRPAEERRNGGGEETDSGQVTSQQLGG